MDEYFEPADDREPDGEYETGAAIHDAIDAWNFFPKETAKWRSANEFLKGLDI